jgi:hypothetical protein
MFRHPGALALPAERADAGSVAGGRVPKANSGVWS